MYISQRLTDKIARLREGERGRHRKRQARRSQQQTGPARTKSKRKRNVCVFLESCLLLFVGAYRFGFRFCSAGSFSSTFSILAVLTRGRCCCPPFSSLLLTLPLFRKKSFSCCWCFAFVVIVVIVNRSVERFSSFACLAPPLPPRPPLFFSAFFPLFLRPSPLRAPSSTHA